MHLIRIIEASEKDLENLIGSLDKSKLRSDPINNIFSTSFSNKLPGPRATRGDVVLEKLVVSWKKSLMEKTRIGRNVPRSHHTLACIKNSYLFEHVRCEQYIRRSTCFGDGSMVS